MATHEYFNMDPFWDEEYKTFGEEIKEISFSAFRINKLNELKFNKIIIIIRSNNRK